jgi:hypothetical protein
MIMLSPDQGSKKYKITAKSVILINSEAFFEIKIKKA